MREQPFFHAADKHRVKLQPLGGMHGHHLQRVSPGDSLMLARLERSMRQKCSQHAVVAVRRGGGRGRVLHGRHVRCVPHHQHPIVLDHKRRRCVDQFGQVLQAVSAFFFILVVRVQPAVFDDMFDGFGQRQTVRGLAHFFDQPDKGTDARRRLARQRIGTGCLPQADAALARHRLHLFQTARADAARGEINHPQQRAIIIRLRHQPQIRQRMLDFLTLEKAQPAIHAIRHRGIEQRMLDHP